MTPQDQEDDRDRPAALDAVPPEPLDHRVQAQRREHREGDVDEDRRDVGQRDPEQQGHEPAEGQQQPDGEGTVEARPEGRPWPFSAIATDDGGVGRMTADGVGRGGIRSGCGACRERLGRGVCHRSWLTL